VALWLAAGAVIAYNDFIAVIPGHLYMAILTIRKLPDDVKQDLRERAARNGRSLEEEARRALIALVRPAGSAQRKSIGQMLYEMSRPGLELPIPPRSPARIPDME
jgi:plasmid stability protein